MTRDAMIFRPSLGRRLAAHGSAPVRAREDRVLAEQQKRGGFFRRAAAARAARRGLRRRTVATAQRSSRRLPWMALPLIAGITGGLAALRLATGKPLEGTGQDLNNLLVGDLDVDARAARAVRQRLTSNRDVLRIVGQEGGINSQIQRVAEDLREVAQRRERGEKRIREQFPMNSTLDILILRVVAVVKRAFNSGGGQASLEKLKNNFQEMAMNSGARGR